MNFTVTYSISLVTVFLEGLLSFFSPCVLPLLPLYLSYLAGGTGRMESDGSFIYERRKTVVNTLFFVIGISTTFVLLALGMRGAGSIVRESSGTLSLVGGIFIIIYGLWQFFSYGTKLGGTKELRLPIEAKAATGCFSAFLLGFVFSFSWTPCVGPVLTTVLLTAASVPSAAKGFALVALYTLGFTLPFLITGIFASTLLSLFRRHRKALKYTAKAGAALMVLLGVLMCFGVMDDVSSKLGGVSSVPEPDIIVCYDASGEMPLYEMDELMSDEIGAEDEAIKEKIPEVAGETLDEVAEERVAEESSTYSSFTADDGDKAEGKETASEEAVEEEPFKEDVADREEAVENTEASEEAKEEREEKEDENAYLPAPDFVLMDSKGNLVKLSSFKGKTVFLNFWATWCGPCRSELGEIEVLYNRYKDSDSVVILTITAPGRGGEVSSGEIKSFMKENGYTFPVLFDSTGKVLSSYAITAFPTTFMIGRSGSVYGYVPGALSLALMEDIIRQTEEDDCK